MNKAFEKAIASARYFKNKGEIDMWHCIWHDGKPYDYHLYVEDGVSEVYIYDVDKINNEYVVNTDKTLHIHTFKTLPQKQSCSKCGNTDQSEEDMKQCFTNLLLCDDCYTETRVLVADHLGCSTQELNI